MAGDDLEDDASAGYAVVSNPARKFKVTVQDVQVVRQWSQEDIFRDHKPKEPSFRSYITGLAVGDGILNEVCVLGTGRSSREFHLRLTADNRVKETWELLKSTDLLVRPTLEKRQSHIRRLQHELFDQTPPTASIFTERDLECEIPAPILEKLTADLLSGLVEKVHISIQWPFGFATHEFGSWGFFEGGKLTGYVSSIYWVPAAPPILISKTEHNQDNEITQSIKHAARLLEERIIFMLAAMLVILGAILIALIIRW